LKPSEKIKNRLIGNVDSLNIRVNNGHKLAIDSIIAPGTHVDFNKQYRLPGSIY